MIKLVIADDHELVRAGIRRLLEADGDIVVLAEAGNGHEAVRLCGEHKPDIAVLDYNMPDIDGLETTRQIVALGADIKVLILTMYDNEEYAVRVIQAGATGFIVKGTSPEELLAAVRRLAGGKTYITPSVMEKIAFKTSADKENPVSTLSDRELQVLVMLARGHVVKEVSEKLSLSPSTVETYRRRLMEKLGLRNLSDITRLAIRSGLIEKL